MKISKEIDKSAKQLAWQLGITPSVSYEIQSNISKWVSAYKNSVTPPYSSSHQLSGKGQSKEDQTLKVLLKKLSHTDALFAWALMWRYHDSLSTGLGLSITGPRLSIHIDSIKPKSINDNEALYLAMFFQNTYLDACLDDEFWKLCNNSKLINIKSNSCRDELLCLFLLLTQKRFGYSFSKICRILRKIQKTDKKSINILENFKDCESRGSSLLVQKTYSLVGLDNTNFPGKNIADILNWLSNAKTKFPSDKWLDKKIEIESAISHQSLNDICHWIVSNQQYRYFGDKPFRDDLYCNVSKGASWYLKIDLHPS